MTPIKWENFNWNFCWMTVNESAFTCCYHGDRNLTHFSLLSFSFLAIVFWNVWVVDDEHLNYFPFFSVSIVTFHWIARLRFSKRWFLFFNASSSVVHCSTWLKSTDVGLRVQACYSTVDKCAELPDICFFVIKQYQNVNLHIYESGV
jgi:hypothetical protein